MNILITNFHLKDGGGHRTYIKYIFNFFNKNGHNIYIASPNSSHLNCQIRERNSDAIFDVEFPTKLKEIGNLIKNIFKLRKIIKLQDIELVHVNGSPDHKVIAIVKWLFRFKYKIIRTKHDSFPIKNSFFNKKMYRKYTDHFILVSKYQKDQLIDNDYLNQKTSVIKNGVDIGHFRPRKPNTKLRLDLNIRERDLVMISSAGTAEHKGWHFLALALEKLDQKLRNKIKVILLGNMPNPSLIKKYNLENFIFTGFIDDVRDIVAIADIGFVLSYKVETISYACREMMAMGKPVMVSNYAGLPENIDDGEDGWIVNTSEKGSIIKVLQDINSSSLKVASIKARKKALEEFNIDQNNQILLSLYEGTLKN